MKIAFYTLGCKVNQYETDKMKEEFIKNKFEVVSFTDLADIYVVNSCSVTNLATRKTRNMISRAKKLGGIVVLCGCYAQELENKNEASKINADIIIGNEEKNDIVNIVNNFMADNKINKKVFKVSNIGEIKKYTNNKILNSSYEIRESIKIEDGCNNFCSYCIIPYVRGRIRSRKLDDIIKEVKNLSLTGTREIVLVGIEISSYGKDLDENLNLVDVVEEVSNVEGIERIRLGSLEPRVLTDENILRLSRIEKLCPHFHISVQSLNDNVLKNMNRKYDSNFVIGRINKLKEVFKDVALTCDIIVGFPKETDEDFIDTINKVKEIGFYEIHTFKYSKRKWTLASKMDGQVLDTIKNERSETLIKIANELKYKYMKKFLGKKVNVLIEKYSDGYLEGYTSNYIKVKTRGERNLWGKVLKIELSSIKEDYMLGTI